MKTALLAQIPLFAGLSETELQALAQRTIERRYAAGEALFWEGDPCAGIFLIVQGSVKIFKTSPNGREMMLALETAPCTVAELPLFDGGPYPASVRAVEDILACFINKHDFQAVCRQYPDLALKVLAVLVAFPWQELQRFSAKSRLPRAALPSVLKNCRAQTCATTWRISSWLSLGSVCAILGEWFHMSTAMSVMV